MRDKRFKNMTNEEFIRMAERQCYLSIKNTKMGNYLHEALLRLEVANVKIKGIKDGKTNTAGNTADSTTGEKELRDDLCRLRGSFSASDTRA